MPDTHPADAAFAAVAAFLAGIIGADLGWSAAACAGAALAAATAALIRPRAWKLHVLFFAAFAAGVIYCGAFYAIADAQRNLPLNRGTAFSALIADEPVLTSKGSFLYTADAAPPFRGSFLFLAPPAGPEAEFAYGDLVTISGTLEASREPHAPPIMFSPAVGLVAQHKGFFFRDWMLGIKAAAIREFRGALPADEAGLLGGIMFGYRAGIPPDLRNELSRAGAAHIIAVSGYQIMILVAVCGAFFKKFLPRRASLAATAALIVLFISMTGWRASAVRAAIMGVVALAARAIGEAPNLRNLIAFTAAAMVLADPSAPVFNVGFILSFVGLLGIIFLGPPIRGLLRAGGPAPAHAPFGLRDAAAIVLSAQIAVMPILIRAFGPLSLVGVFANVLVTATIPATMALGTMLAVFGFASGRLAFFAAQCAGFFLRYQLLVIRTFAALAVPVPFSFDSAFFIASYYLLLALFVFSRRSSLRAAGVPASLPP